MKDILREEALFHSVRCASLPVVGNLGYDEAYRFEYAAAFCDTSITITIGNRKNVYVVETALYRPGRHGDTCRLLSTTRKNIEKKDWEKIIDELDHDDFWGLKAGNGRFGVDG